MYAKTVVLVLALVSQTYATLDVLGRVFETGRGLARDIVRVPVNLVSNLLGDGPIYHDFYGNAYAYPYPVHSAYPVGSDVQVSISEDKGAVAENPSQSQLYATPGQQYAPGIGKYLLPNAPQMKTFVETAIKTVQGKMGNKVRSEEVVMDKSHLSDAVSTLQTNIEEISNEVKGKVDHIADSVSQAVSEFESQIEDITEKVKPKGRYR